MTHKKHKIEITSSEDVKKYGGDQPTDSAAPAEGAQQGESAPPAETEGQAAAEAAPAESAEAQEWKDRCLRARAELANYQRRVEKERSDLVRYANAGLAKSLLPVLDNLERVIESGRQNPDSAAVLLEGVKMTLEHFLKALREANVERIEAEGVPFDPQVHEAMMEQPSAEHAERTVLQEVMKGYRLSDRVLRPAKVIVSKPTEPADETADRPADEGEQSKD